MRDKQDEFGLHESEWTRRGPDPRGRVIPLLHDWKVAIAGGIEGESDKKRDQR